MQVFLARMPLRSAVNLLRAASTKPHYPIYRAMIPPNTDQWSLLMVTCAVYPYKFVDILSAEIPMCSLITG